MPFGHVGGYAVLLRTWYFGAEAVILPEFEPEAVLRAIGAHRISKIALVPAMIQRLLASPSARVTDYRRLTLLFYGTSPIQNQLDTHSVGEGTGVSVRVDPGGRRIN